MTLRNIDRIYWMARIVLSLSSFGILFIRFILSKESVGQPCSLPSLDPRVFPTAQDPDENGIGPAIENTDDGMAASHRLPENPKE